jgi:pimeloyl-ACP methyl ester carboxylesterase
MTTKQEVETMSPSLATKFETLKVPGASLYYEVRGSGPVLLMMPGGPADATAFRTIASQLATHYPVVTYDPRGLSRSKLEGPLDEARIVEVFADDVFPGDHGGFQSHAAEFAAKLREVLEG